LVDPGNSTSVVVSSHEATVFLWGLYAFGVISALSFVLFKLDHLSEAAINIWYSRREQIKRRRAALEELDRELSLQRSP
jgi:hypothetical protein